MNHDLTILCDVDGVLADFNGALSQALAEEGFPGYTEEHYHTWDLKKCISPEAHKALDRIQYKKGFCSSIPRYPGAQDFFRELKRRGTVLALTTAWNGSNWLQERYDWLVSFGFADREIFIVESHEHKRVFGGHVMIEDREQTLKEWSGKGKLLMDRPWNRVSLEGTDIKRCRSYAEILEAIG